MDQLEKLYVDYSFPSYQKFVELAKQNSINITPKEIKKFLENQKTYQLYKQAKRVVGHPIVTGKPFEAYQCDLTDMSKLSKQNKGYKYILLIIDIFTRYAIGIPLKSKSPEVVVEAFEEAFQRIPKPKSITSDNGSEWMGKVLKYLKNNNINHITNEVGDHNKLGVIDRLTRTLKEKMYKTMTYNDDAKWKDNFENIVEIYNQTPHRTLGGYSPFEASLPENEQIITQLQIERVKKAKRYDNFKIGDIVRVKKQRRTFERAFDTKWKNKTNKIVDKVGIVYILDDGSEKRGQFLQKVNSQDNDVSISPVTIEKENMKQEQLLKREDIDKNNVIDQSVEAPVRKGNRTRKKKEILDL